jgi:hypothetical protein
MFSYAKDNMNISANGSVTAEAGNASLPTEIWQCRVHRRSTGKSMKMVSGYNLLSLRDLSTFPQAPSPTTTSFRLIGVVAMNQDRLAAAESRELTGIGTVNADTFGLLNGM